MARRVPGYASGKERKFIPESFENRSDDAPIAVWIRTPTEREKREVMSTAAANVETDSDGAAVLDESGAPRIKLDLEYSIRWQNAVVKRFVSRVENYGSSADTPIETAADLLEHGETEILSEVAAEILTGLSLADEEKKHLPGLSDTSPNQIQAPNGIVESVEPGALQQDAGAV